MKKDDFTLVVSFLSLCLFELNPVTIVLFLSPRVLLLSSIFLVFLRIWLLADDSLSFGSSLCHDGSLYGVLPSSEIH